LVTYCCIAIVKAFALFFKIRLAASSQIVGLNMARRLRNVGLSDLLLKSGIEFCRSWQAAQAVAV